MKTFISTMTAVLSILGLQGCATQEFSIEKIFDVADLISEDVTVTGASQGFAIYEDKGFFFHDGGQVLIIDLDKQSLISTFVIPGLEEAHCNNAGFSNERYSDDSPFPLLYVTECKTDNRCYVVDLGYDTGRVVQSIFYDGDDYNKNFDWCIDSERGFIYTRGGNKEYWVKNPTDPDRGRWMMLKKFPLPTKQDFNENGEIHLELADAVDSFAVDNVYFGQGSVIHNGIMHTGEGAPSACHCRIHIIDLDKHERLAIHDVSELGLEPEGFAAKGGCVYITFHTPGRPRNNILYKYKL